ncbi:MAG: hypothetical protein K5644_00585 [Lachnospiraceae bacterium]|nr:hypothetical protein [Lachnospiraceae bacterium]
MKDLMIVILITVAFVAVIGFIVKLYMDKLTADGKIVKREGKFFEAEHIFTVTGIDYNSVEQSLKSLNLRECGISETYFGNGGRPETLLKSSGGWNALIKFENEANGQYVYNFSIPVYSTHNGNAMGIIKMNMLLTSVEKMFLGLDPNTIVETKKKNYKYQK